MGVLPAGGVQFSFKHCAFAFERLAQFHGSRIAVNMFADKISERLSRNGQPLRCTIQFK